MYQLCTNLARNQYAHSPRKSMTSLRDDVEDDVPSSGTWEDYRDELARIVSVETSLLHLFDTDELRNICSSATTEFLLRIIQQLGYHPHQLEYLDSTFYFCWQDYSGNAHVELESDVLNHGLIDVYNSVKVLETPHVPVTTD